MVASGGINSIESLAEQLCDDMIHGIYRVAGRNFIATRFNYPNGDSVNVYLDESESGPSITDMGTTHYVMAVDGVEFTTSRLDFIHTVCVRHGVQFSNNRFSRQLTPNESPSAHLIALCETIAQVSSLHYDALKRQGSRFYGLVETLVSAKISTARDVDRDWTDERYDPQRIYTVDYHCNGQGVPKDLYVVTSSLRAERAFGSIMFWQGRSGSDSLAIVDPDASISSASLARLRGAANLVQGVDGHERAIVEFSVSKSRSKFLPSLFSSSVIFSTKNLSTAPPPVTFADENRPPRDAEKESQ